MSVKKDIAVAGTIFVVLFGLIFYFTSVYTWGMEEDTGIFEEDDNSSSMFVYGETKVLYSFSPDYMNFTINGEYCEEVPCPCHKDNPMCLTICYSCEEHLSDEVKK